MGAKRNGRELQAALAGREPVRLQRSLTGAEWLDGFVMAVADDWVLLHRFHNVQLDGWSAVRLDTVRRVERDGDDSLVSRVLRARSQQPTGIEVDLTNVVTVTKSVAKALPLVTFNREALYPGECVIGRPIRFTKKRVHLINVDTDATWDLEPYRLDLADITRVDGGRDYETGLYQLAGEPPASP